MLRANKNKQEYTCCICHQPTHTLHEIFFGNGWRELSIKNNIQVPLCNAHHMAAHHEYKRQITWKKRFCLLANVSYDGLVEAFGDRFNMTYLEKAKKAFKVFLKSKEYPREDYIDNPF